MSTKQYTIRSIPEPVVQALHQRARKTGKSFNATVIEALWRGVGIKTPTNTQLDLDHLIGVGIQGKKGFNSAQHWLDSLPSDMQ